VHPYVMGAMNAFLSRLNEPPLQGAYDCLDAVWNARAARLNARLQEERLPVTVANLTSIWTTAYPAPSRYNWMFQYYLRAEGLSLPWTGTARLIFSHDYTDHDFDAMAGRFVDAARAMRAGGWWWHPPDATHASVQRRVLVEMAAARLGLRGWIMRRG